MHEHGPAAVYMMAESEVIEVVGRLPCKETRVEDGQGGGRRSFEGPQACAELKRDIHDAHDNPDSSNSSIEGHPALMLSFLHPPMMLERPEPANGSLLSTQDSPHLRGPRQRQNVQAVWLGIWRNSAGSHRYARTLPPTSHARCMNTTISCVK